MENNLLGIDGESLLDMLMNGAMLNDERVAPAIGVCNKYGLFGTKAMQFLIELGTVAKQMCEDNGDGE